MNSNQKVIEFFAGYPTKLFDVGQTILFPDKKIEKIYFIESGLVHQHDISKAGDDIIINIFKAESLFPLVNAIANEPNPFFFKAVSPTVLRIAPSVDVLNFIKTDPELLYDLTSRIFRGMVGLTKRVSQLMSGSGFNRVIFELVIEARRFGKKIANNKYELKMSELQLAHISGLSRETFNRELSKLKKIGLIKVGHGLIVIEDLDKLEAILEED